MTEADLERLSNCRVIEYSDVDDLVAEVRRLRAAGLREGATELRARADMHERDGTSTALRPAEGETTPAVGDLVSKVGGDYRFDGTVVAAFTKLGGAARYVVEDDRGILHIFGAKNLHRRPAEGACPDSDRVPGPCAKAGRVRHEFRSSVH